MIIFFQCCFPLLCRISNLGITIRQYYFVSIQCWCSNNCLLISTTFRSVTGRYIGIQCKIAVEPNKNSGQPSSKFWPKIKKFGSYGPCSCIRGNFADFPSLLQHATHTLSTTSSRGSLTPRSKFKGVEKKRDFSKIWCTTILVQAQGT